MYTRSHQKIKENILTCFVKQQFEMNDQQFFKSVYRDIWEELCVKLCFIFFISFLFVSENCIVITTNAKLTKKNEPI